MRLTILSGKGGTGKTLISTNLAVFIAHKTKHTVTYIDADVEEPNGTIFLSALFDTTQDVTVPVPHLRTGSIDIQTARQVAHACVYNALVPAGASLQIYSELCHSCGVCTYLAGEALEEIPRTIGTIRRGMYNTVLVIEGRLNIGEIRATPLIKELLDYTDTTDITIIDAPPGCSCSVMESLSSSQKALLVTEPTDFGLHDLKKAVQLVKAFSLPYAVIINRSDIGNDNVYHYLRNNFPIIAEIPFDDTISSAYLESRPVGDASQALNTALKSITLWLEDMP